jgi:hypothetical protein
MVKKEKSDAILRRVHAMNDRVSYLSENDLYYYNQPIS